jgi:hypothetical protein
MRRKMKSSNGILLSIITISILMTYIMTIDSNFISISGSYQNDSPQPVSIDLGDKVINEAVTYNNTIRSLADADTKGINSSALYEVTFEINPSKSGEAYCNGQNVSAITKMYPSGTLLKCQARPNNDFMFDSWSGISFSSNESVTFAVYQNGTLSANFRESLVSFITNKVLPHPFLILMIGAILSGFLIPYYTKRWQNRQKEIEIKSNLVAQISKSVIQITMSTQFVILKNNYGMITTDEDKKKLMDELNNEYKQWEISSAIIGSQLQAYFPHIASSWGSLKVGSHSFSERVSEFYKLSNSIGIRGKGKEINFSKERQSLIKEMEKIINNVVKSNISVFK